MARPLISILRVDLPICVPTILPQGRLHFDAIFESAAPPYQGVKADSVCGPLRVPTALAANDALLLAVARAFLHLLHACWFP